MSELLHEFGVDWKLLLAQAVNFFVLLVLLKKFAYGPILKLLHRRKEEIRKGILFTKEAEERLGQIGKKEEEILGEAKEQALKIVSEAEELGKKRKGELLQEANLKVEGVVTAAKRAIAQEKSKMGEEVYADARVLVEKGIERVIGALPPHERNQKLIDEALNELRSAGQT